MPVPRARNRPTALKVLAGEQKSKINNDEPQPEEGIPGCPSENEKVREVWDYTIRQLLVMKVVTMVDRDLLHAYCEAVVQHREALAQIEEEGLIISHHTGHRMRHPAVGIAKDAAAQMKALGIQFGLTPSSRASIRVTDSQKKPKEAGAARLLTG